MSEALRQAFIVYLISHGRPIAEVLPPGRKDIRAEFEQNFDGMAVEDVALDTLLAARGSSLSKPLPPPCRHLIASFWSDSRRGRRIGKSLDSLMRQDFRRLNSNSSISISYRTMCAQRLSRGFRRFLELKMAEAEAGALSAQFSVRNLAVV
ncbi:hypothetical protein J2W42_004191 [Rhizobium tibeticum]|uniref:hypothetical protein n=1 Tax=Rhizobium tibeticum TaxID=501024 RepID=UPI002783A227|nr:hypothetical protein [Rhizobium tibeticum]MDP9811328.1 hypothetical protein [Rhizobium tibeticum]